MHPAHHTDINHDFNGRTEIPDGLALWNRHRLVTDEQIPKIAAAIHFTKFLITVAKVVFLYFRTRRQFWTFTNRKTLTIKFPTFFLSKRFPNTTPKSDCSTPAALPVFLQPDITNYRGTLFLSKKSQIDLLFTPLPTDTDSPQTPSTPPQSPPVPKSVPSYSRY